MKERGLTFCQELVPKVLDGSKTVTRRLGGLKEINENPDEWFPPAPGGGEDCWRWPSKHAGQDAAVIKCPHGVGRDERPQGVAGDRFYMQEAWGLLYPDHKPMNHRAAVIGAWRAAVDATAEFAYSVAPLIPVYKVDHITGNDGPKKVRWRSGRFQPKWACRPQRWELVSIRPERLQEITRADLWAEGFRHDVEGAEAVLMHLSTQDDQTKILKKMFGTELWDTINAKRGYPWERNNWVWREEWNPEPVVGECVGA